MKERRSGTTTSSESYGMGEDAQVSFSVWTEPWIPVRGYNGELDMLSMRDTLTQSPTLLEVSDISPLVEYGLYRLLITVLMDALRPDSQTDLELLLEDGSFDNKLLDQYAQDCEENGFSWDLFDPEHPFLQTRYNSEWDKAAKPANSLDYTLPHGQNHVHFSHGNPEEGTYTYAEAARMLPALQLFCTAGLQGPSGVNASPPYFTVVRGANLFETLVRSMVPIDSIADFDSQGPWWRNEIEVEPKKDVYETSWLMGMMFPARRVLLIPEEGEIRRIFLGAGLNYSLKDTWVDPHVAYVPQKDKEGNILETRTPWRPRFDVPVWLNIEQLISPDRQAAIVKAIEDDHADLQMYGVQTQQAKYIDAARFELILPMKLSGNEIGRIKAMRCVDDAKIIADGLRRALTTGAPVKGGDSRHDVHFPASTVDTALWEYYGRCEAALWDMLDRLSAAGSKEEADAEHLRWLMNCRKSALEVYESVVRASNVRTGALMALETRRNWLMSAINKCMPKEEKDTEPQT